MRTILLITIVFCVYLAYGAFFTQKPGKETAYRQPSVYKPFIDQSYIDRKETLH